MTRFIAYLRVSTEKQGLSGLGLEAQQDAVKRFLREGDVLGGTFVEIESGRNNDRPQLAAAIEECKRSASKLILARLDRLSRSVHFISGLMESGVPFVAADMPQASDFELHIRAAIAQEERRLISIRTKAALAAAKARGVVLGGFRGRHLTTAERSRGTAKANAAKATAARARAVSLLPIVEQVKATGATTLAAIADGLNGRGIPTAKGGSWAPVQVMRLLRYAA